MSSQMSAVKPASVSSALQLYVYRLALHPELFQLKGRKKVKHNGYEVEAWLLSAGHVVRFSHAGFSCTELMTDQESRLPMNGAVTGFACVGEHDFEHRFGAERVGYTTSVQTETLSESLYKATYQEMLDFARETEALVYKWNDEQGRRCMSMLDLQRLSKEMHVQSYHLIAQGGQVVRTQTIFEHT